MKKNIITQYTLLAAIVVCCNLHADNGDTSAHNFFGFNTVVKVKYTGPLTGGKLPNDQDITVQLKSDLDNTSTFKSQRGTIWYRGCSGVGECFIMRLYEDPNKPLTGIIGKERECEKMYSGTVCTIDPKEGFGHSLDQGYYRIEPLNPPFFSMPEAQEAKTYQQVQEKLGLTRQPIPLS